ncbi:MAG: tRNA pseudouridine(55) synthase TruB [Clostridia bacterium]|nr:tRNA pseudouridine(55) synthase TruB [Clostridia bacterium]
MGLILIDKPQGITSFGAVARIKRLTGEKRVGHTGTLDPMATGVLPIFTGRATALSSYLLDADKTYVAGVTLGINTDTYDITVTVTASMSQDKLSRYKNSDITEVLSAFKGRQKQVPPMYSALKKDGVRLYDLARQGKVTDIPEREIEIFEIEQTKPLNGDFEFEFKVKVSKGTYIRSLCNDIGIKLGCGATLISLCRTNTCGIDIKECVNLDTLNSDNIGNYVMNEEYAVSHFRAVNVTEKQAVRFSNGGKLSLDRLKPDIYSDKEVIRVKYGDLFLGLGTVDLTLNELAVKCVINDYKTGEK